MLTRQLRRSRFNFAQCKEFLAAGKNPQQRKLANNTYLLAIGNPTAPEHYAIKLHDTHIVEIYPDDSVKLFTGGWQTLTTKQRINSFSPIGIYQSAGVWYLSPDVEFFEGIHLSAAGDILR